MKGGKADKTRRSAPGKPTHPRGDPGKTKAKARPDNMAPKKGSRKRPDVGGGSSSGED
ncbi:MAG: hypothetical protein ABJB74_02840 [Gemmatimonas sp.]